jgi:hypothetical protein
VHQKGVELILEDRDHIDINDQGGRCEPPDLDEGRRWLICRVKASTSNLVHPQPIVHIRDKRPKPTDIRQTAAYLSPVAASPVASLALMACAQVSIIDRTWASACCVEVGVWFVITMFQLHNMTLVFRRDRVMFMRDAPVVIDLPQPDRQPEQKSFAGATTHDCDGEGNVFARGDFKLFDIERL